MYRLSYVSAGEGHFLSCGKMSIYNIFQACLKNHAWDIYLSFELQFTTGRAVSSDKAKDKRKIYAEFKWMSEILSFWDYLNITLFFFYLCIWNMQERKIFIYEMCMSVCNNITSSMKHHI